MATYIQRGTTPSSCVTSTGMCKLYLYLCNLSCPIPTQLLLHMVQHVADRVTRIPHSATFPSNSSILILHLPSSLTCMRVRCNLNHPTVCLNNLFFLIAPILWYRDVGGYLESNLFSCIEFLS